ncbi:hypothetical protein M0805_007616 [Coniferiporia weirii]|nr:hypothetical protein M0805_007616 [Coniferiporia weirii]
MSTTSQIPRHRRQDRVQQRNSASVGVWGLNAIRSSALSTALLPIHLLLRIALECMSAAAAIAELERLGGPASSHHVLIADATVTPGGGEGARGLELSPHGSAYLAPEEQGIIVHTNHFLENKAVREVARGCPARLCALHACGSSAQTQSDFFFVEVSGGAGAESVTPALLRERVYSDRGGRGGGVPQAICRQVEAADGRQRDRVVHKMSW